MLNFTFTYQKTSSLFHFIENLSEWHYSCRLGDNKEWLAQTGELTLEEQVALGEMRLLLQKYDFGEKFLGIPFITISEERIWEVIKEWVEPDEYTTLHTVFQVFSPRFNILWQQEEAKLHAWKNKLEELVGQKSYGKQIEGLETFFNIKVQSKTVKVCLLINASEKGGGGNANMGDRIVTLDCSSMNIELVKRLYSTLWHETIHLVFEKEQLNSLLKDFLKDKGNFLMQSALGQILKSPTALLKEAIVTAVEAYLAKTYLNLDVEEEQRGKLGVNFEAVKARPKNYRLWYFYAAQKLLPTIKEYIDQNRSVDIVFLERTFNFYQDYLKLLMHSSA